MKDKERISRLERDVKYLRITVLVLIILIFLTTISTFRNTEMIGDTLNVIQTVSQNNLDLVDIDRKIIEALTYQNEHINNLYEKLRKLENGT